MMRVRRRVSSDLEGSQIDKLLDTIDRGVPSEWGSFRASVADAFVGRSYNTRRDHNVSEMRATDGAIYLPDSRGIATGRRRRGREPPTRRSRGQAQLAARKVIWSVTD